MITNMPAPDHFDELLCHWQCFSKDQRKKDGGDSEPDTMSSFQKTPTSHWRSSEYLQCSLFWPNLLKNVCKPWGLGCWLCLSRFNLALFEQERSWCRNWIVTFPWKKIWSVFEFLTQITPEEENELAEIRELFPKKLTKLIKINPSTMTTNLPWKASLSFAMFFLQGPTEERWKRLRERHSARFPKYSSVTLKS